MDNSCIFNSDFMIDTALKIMSPSQLFLFRQVTKYLADAISIDLIKTLIINKIQTKLQNMFKDKYSTFINLLSNNPAKISGIWITQFLFSENWTNDIYISYDCTLNDFLHKNICLLENYDNDGDTLLFNLYGNIIELAFNDDTTCRYPDIFNNSVSIINEKWVLSIGSIKKIINRTETLDLSTNYTYCFDNATILILCKRHNIYTDIKKCPTNIIHLDRPYLVGFYDNLCIMLFNCILLKSCDTINIKGSDWTSTLTITKIDNSISVFSFPHYYAVLTNNKGISIDTIFIRSGDGKFIDNTYNSCSLQINCEKFKLIEMIKDNNWFTKCW